MKKISLLVIIVLSIGSVLCVAMMRNSSSKLLIKDKNLEQMPDGMRRYPETVKNLHEGWAYIRLGDTYAREHKYEEAVAAYKKSYEIDPGNGLMSGSLLIKTYEKMSQYDEALIVVDDILKNQPLVEIGKQMFNDTRAHLLAAKAQAAQNQAASSP